MSNSDGFATGRFARTLTLIGVVTATFLFVGANRLDDRAFAIGAVAIGAVALVTAITGFIIAGAQYYDEGDGGGPPS